jgi:hypothetical protein
MRFPMLALTRVNHAKLLAQIADDRAFEADWPAYVELCNAQRKRWAPKMVRTLQRVGLRLPRLEDELKRREASWLPRYTKDMERSRFNRVTPEQEAEALRKARKALVDMRLAPVLRLAKDIRAASNRLLLIRRHEAWRRPAVCKREIGIIQRAAAQLEARADSLQVPD